MKSFLTIGEVVKRSGIAASALRFYEDKGLIWSLRPDPDGDMALRGKGATGHRRYHRGVLRRIAFIVFAQKLGLSLDDIATELGKLPPGRPPTRKDWEKISSTWTAKLDERIAELQRLKLGLGECIGCGCLSLDKCPLANPGDRASAAGAGPRYWIGGRRR